MGGSRVLLVTDDRRTISGGLGRASIVTVAEVDAEGIQAWEEHAVPWRERHDAEPHGTHHDSILAFVRQADVRAIVADHVGAPMRSQLADLGITVFEHGGIDARAAALAAAGVVTGQSVRGDGERRR